MGFGTLDDGWLEFLEKMWEGGDSSGLGADADGALAEMVRYLIAGIAILEANTRASIAFPSEVEIPESGTTTYRMWLMIYDEAGNMEVPDAIPNITIYDATGNTEVASTPMTYHGTAGVYRYDVAIANTETPESWTAYIVVIEGGVSRQYAATFDLVHDTVGLRDDTTTDTVHGKLGTDAEMGDVSFYDLINGAVAYLDGTAQQSLADMPYIQASLSFQRTPRVDQSSEGVADLSLHNLRPDADVIQTGEFSGATISIARQRLGTDASWNTIVNGQAMSETTGLAYYPYDFPNASWQPGDLVRYVVSGATIEIPAASGQIYKIPQLNGYGVVGGSSAIVEMLGRPGLFESTAATVNTVTCASLVDRADLYEGMMIVPVEGDQLGQGRYITAYDGNDVLTVVPDWSTDPDASGNFRFTIIPVPLKFAYEAGKGLSAIYDLVNGIPVLSRIYSDFDIQVLTVEETVFEYDDAAYVWHPRWLVYHLDEMANGEQVEVKVYEKDNDTDNNERLMLHLVYNNVQAVPVKYLELPPVDLYFKVTVEQTGGTLRDVIFKLYKES